MFEGSMGDATGFGATSSPICFRATADHVIVRAMMNRRFSMERCVAFLILLALSGCSTIRHELQPHRLARWNFQENPSRTSDALFSIDDPMIPAEVSAPDMSEDETSPLPQSADRN